MVEAVPCVPFTSSTERVGFVVYYVCHAPTWAQRYENLYQTTFATLPRPFRQFRVNRSHTLVAVDSLRSG